MKEQIFRYYKGEENIVVVEKENYEESLFREQYIQALQLVTELAERPKKDVPNLVAFCGDRGEGKTSCMLTVCHIIKNSAKPAIASEMEPLGIDTKKLTDAGFEVLPIIDPAFFDKEHNIIELLLGHIYKNFKNWREKDENQSYGAANDVAKLFQKTKACLMHIAQTKMEMYDPLEELEVLSAGVELSECISTLMEKYLALTRKKKLLICIDDIDLNMSRAYRMCEEIRKYLNNPNCLILMSVKVDQLIEAIQNDIHEEANYPSTIDFSGMATKYVAKLIPVTVRVNMPKAYDLCDYRLEVYDGRQKDGKLIYPSLSVKNGVVRKIFATSRFLFYNSKSSVSPIVPNNLRSLMQLLGLLFSMREIDSVEKEEATEVLGNNKSLMKAYLYKSWLKQLKPVSQAFAEGLTLRQDGNDVNKYVVEFLARHLAELKVDDDLVKEITKGGNFSYNISIGDVLYLVDYLEQCTTDDDLNKALFFVKAFYSIRLFEKYDVVTDHLLDELYPETVKGGNLFRADALFEHTNVLQRFVAGSYFTYYPQDLLSPVGAGFNRQSRDYKPINGKSGLNDLLVTLSKILKDTTLTLTPDQKELVQTRFRMAEFFMLTILRSIPKRNILVNKSGVQLPPVKRGGSEPTYLTSYNISTGYYVFDMLAPFYALTNPQYAYGRFEKIADLYNTAINSDWSLLRQMMEAVRQKEIKENEDIIPEAERATYRLVKDDLDYWKWRLLSNAVIRNAEVAQAVMENSKHSKESVRVSRVSRDLIADVYNNIIKSNMVTYNRSESESPYCINFDFLNPIIALLRNDRLDDECVIGDHRLPSFDQVYLFEAAPEDDSSDEDVRDVNIELTKSLFAATLNNFRTMKGKSVINRVYKVQRDLYDKVEAATWKSWFESDKQYTRDDTVDVLRQHLLDFTMEDGETPDVED